MKKLNIILGIVFCMAALALITVSLYKDQLPMIQRQISYAFTKDESTLWEIIDSGVDDEDIRILRKYVPVMMETHSENFGSQDKRMQKYRRFLYSYASADYFCSFLNAEEFDKFLDFFDKYEASFENPFDLYPAISNVLLDFIFISEGKDLDAYGQFLQTKGALTGEQLDTLQSLFESIYQTAWQTTGLIPYGAEWRLNAGRKFGSPSVLMMIYRLQGDLESAKSITKRSQDDAFSEERQYVTHYWFNDPDSMKDAA